MLSKCSTPVILLIAVESTPVGLITCSGFTPVHWLCSSLVSLPGALFVGALSSFVLVWEPSSWLLSLLLVSEILVSTWETLLLTSFMLGLSLVSVESRSMELLLKVHKSIPVNNFK